MTGLARRLVDAAVSLSPEAHREVRREQWLADLDGADELQMSRMRLGAGAFTTALFHRSRAHRSTWGDPVTTVPTARPPLTIRVGPLLIGLAFASMMLGALMFALLSRYNGSAYLRAGIWFCEVLISVVPGLLYMGAIAVAERSSILRRAIAALLVVPLTVLFGGTLLGMFRNFFIVPDWVIFGVVFVGTVAVWFVAHGVRGLAWALVGVPVILLAVSIPLQSFVVDSDTLPVTFVSLALWALIVIPFAGCAFACAAGTRARRAVIALA